MSFLTNALVSLFVSFLWLSPAVSHDKSDLVQNQGRLLSEVPQRVDSKARYLFYLHGRIVEQGRRPTSPQYGFYEYDQILDTFKQNGFVVVSEQRKQGTDVEQYGRKVAGEVRQLLKAGVPPENVTVVGASQGSLMTMLASTYLGNREVNFVIIAGCSADEGFLKLVNLHGHVLSIYERSDQAGSCEKFRTDATGLSEYKEIELNTNLRHGFIYKPMKEWIDPVVKWAQKAN
ncbi:MAG: hypothetical protein ND895_23005 [Pyrinomonadaceae bacterium]|nr:hypothetical protein [Pyrinomonadaceae bacterium]